MKLIIDISEDRYKDVIEAQKHHLLDSYAQAVANGTVLEPCEDAISRADAQTEIMMFVGNEKNNDEIYIKVSDAVQLLRELPSVTPSKEWVRNIHDKEICPYCGKERWSKDV